MKEKAKVSLSAFELQLVTDESYILTKNSIIQKVYELFGNLSHDYRSYLQHVPGSHSPKISKGENYKGLPYVMLDYPRLFSNDDVLAIRSFFWWGKYFSCTLQLKGVYREQYEQNIIHALQHEAFNDCFISDGVHEWNHDVQQGYSQVNSITTASIISLPFIKLVAVHALHEWETTEHFFSKTVQQYVQLLQHQLPRR